MASLFDLPFDDDEPVTPARPAAPVPERRLSIRPPAATAPQSPPAAKPLTAPPPPAAVAASPARTEAAAPRRQVLSVTELTTAIRDHLESEFFTVWVEGELSNTKLWSNGHLYFTLKDDRSQLKGVMFRTQLRYLKFKPADGQRVIARGRLSVYEPRGEYQLAADMLEPKGHGALQLAFEQLKKRLQAEGLFDEARKRPLPALPRKIGIVTSLDGAAIRDMLKVLSRRYRNAQVVIRSTRVQGEGSALDIAAALRAIAKVPGVDVVIVGRGGGSIEDLWAFNEEPVARAIADCPLPVISAVGHETDVTIADFVADRRAPTPSAAAEIVVASRDEFAHRIDRMRDRLDAAMSGRVQMLSRRVHVLASRPALAGFPTRLALRQRDITELSHRLRQRVAATIGARGRSAALLQRRLEGADIGRRVAGVHGRLAGIDGRLRAAVLRRQDRAVAQVREHAARLDSLSPLAVLARGYAVVWNADGTRALRNAADVQPGDQVRVTLAQGELECDVRSRR